MDDRERWWLAESDDDLASGISLTIARIDEATIERQQHILDTYALYGNLTQGVARVLPTSRHISHNVIANAVDTCVTQVTQTRPRPMFVTIGGTWKEQQQARKLTQYMDAKFDLVHAWTLGPQAMRDGIITGLGALRVFTDRDSVIVERIFPGHLLFDDATCVDIAPRSLYLRRFVDRYYLQQLFKDHAKHIENMRAPDSAWSAGANLDVVETWEAWHLASDRDDESGETDGRHTIAVEGAVLSDEPWLRQTFPFAFLRPVPPVCGFWGESLVSRAAPAQVELNKLLRRLQDAMSLHAVPRVFINRQSRIPTAHITNDLGTIVYYDGAPPVFMTPPSMSGDVYAHIERLTRWIFEEIGVSQLSAQSVKPSGLDSGRALRVYNDIQSRRFVNIERAYEDMFLTLAEEIVFQERLLDDSGTHMVSYSSAQNSENLINWSEINLNEGRVRVRLFPTSALPTSPAAKIQALEEMVSDGVIDRQQFYELSPDVPDLESVRNTVTAPIELLHKHFDQMLETGKYISPEPYMDLLRGIDLCARVLQRAEISGAPEDHLELLRQWMGAAKELDSWLRQPEAPPIPPGSPLPPPDMTTEQTPSIEAPPMMMPPQNMAMNGVTQ